MKKLTAFVELNAAIRAIEKWLELSPRTRFLRGATQLFEYFAVYRNRDGVRDCVNGAVGLNGVRNQPTIGSGDCNGRSVSELLAVRFHRRNDTADVQRWFRVGDQNAIKLAELV